MISQGELPDGYVSTVNITGHMMTTWYHQTRESCLMYLCWWKVDVTEGVHSVVTEAMSQASVSSSHDVTPSADNKNKLANTLRHYA